MRPLTLLLGLILAAPLGAATLGEESGFEVNALGGSDFEVLRQQQMGATEMWCAAASYVEVRQGLSETTPIYLRRPLGPAQSAQGRRSVVFSLSNSGLPADDLGRVSINADTPGMMMKSAAARRFCRDAFTRSTK
ncbi:hypothetical protein KDD17_09145 [Sulfitobacter albidus]|uniref:Uncharacterized protein n=1 Tax=Sulfitobacter albidus TaxID=2829501 RepID=A0A975JBF0_9RHOB|nr:hypothetical protein [Sulfitobacter albidus]QUJ75191.1 hypothetical protein KDD17_09145 [Sulfitobacter albidus]